MNINQTAAVVAKIALGDNREVTPIVIQEWHDTIGYLEQHECIEAITVHRRESTAYLQPAHLISIVRRLGNERAERLEHEQRKDALHVVHPKPNNFDAMTAAWNNPAEWAKQEAIYHQQLRDAGIDPHQRQEWQTNPVVCYSCLKADAA